MADHDCADAGCAAGIRAGNAFPAGAALGNAAVIGSGFMGVGCEWILHSYRRGDGADAGNDDRIPNGAAARQRVLPGRTSGARLAFKRQERGGLVVLLYFAV